MELFHIELFDDLVTTPDGFTLNKAPNESISQAKENHRHFLNDNLRHCSTDSVGIVIKNYRKTCERRCLLLDCLPLRNKLLCWARCKMVISRGSGSFTYFIVQLIYLVATLPFRITVDVGYYIRLFGHYIKNHFLFNKIIWKIPK